MHRPSPPALARALVAGIASLLVASVAAGADFYLAGNIGVSALSLDGTGTNDFVGQRHPGRDTDSSPIYGASLGVAFPLDRALPWRSRMPGFELPYWPGRSIHVNEDGEIGFPEWPMRFEIEYQRGTDAELATPGVNPIEPYRVDVDSWSVMGKLRMDVPVRDAARALFGRVPILDPLAVYFGGGAGLAETELSASNAVIFGSDEEYRAGWQALAGIGYELNERVYWSAGWRYLDLGKSKTDLFDSAGIRRGSYSADLSAHEFTTQLASPSWTDARRIGS